MSHHTPASRARRARFGAPAYVWVTAASLLFVAVACAAAPKASRAGGWRPSAQLEDLPPQDTPPLQSALYRRNLRGELTGPVRLMIGPEWSGPRHLRLALLVPLETARSPAFRATAGLAGEPPQGAQVQVGMKLDGGRAKSAWRGALSFDVGRQTQLSIKPRARRVSVTLTSTW